MSRKKEEPTYEQQKLLRAVMDKRLELRDHRARAWVHHEELIKQEAYAIRYELSRLANEAHAAGWSKTKIGRAMGTSNWEWINGIFALAGPAEAQPAEVDAARGNGWVYDADTQTLTLLEWRNRRTNALERKSLEVPLYLNERLGRLMVSDPAANLYGQNIESLWFDGVIDAVNAATGHAHFEQPEEEGDEIATPSVSDYDEMFRQAALHADDDEDED